MFLVPILIPTGFIIKHLDCLNQYEYLRMPASFGVQSECQQNFRWQLYQSFAVTEIMKTRNFT